MINEMLGTKYPIIQGGMANIALGKFAAAVSNAGGLGLIGSGGYDAAIVYWCKFIMPTDKVIKILNKAKNESE